MRLAAPAAQAYDDLLDELSLVAVLFEPRTAVGGALLREQEVKEGEGFVLALIFQGQLHQAARLRRQRGLAQLLRIHLAQALKALDADVIRLSAFSDELLLLERKLGIV